MKLLVLICITLACQVANAQQTKTSDSTYKLQYNDLIKKQHTNKAVGWTLACTGGLVFGIGLAVRPSQHYYIDNDPSKGFPKQGRALRIGGACLGVASIPFFTSASTKGKKALAIKQESVSFFDSPKHKFNYTALAFTLKL